MNTRTFHNQTAHELWLTLFIQCGSDIQQLYGTVNHHLKPNEIKTVQYGDLRNCFLMGMRLKPILPGNDEQYFCRVNTRQDDIDLWLNDNDSVAIDHRRLISMETQSPFDKAAAF